MLTERNVVDEGAFRRRYKKNNTGLIGSKTCRPSTAKSGEQETVQRPLVRVAPIIEIPEVASSQFTGLLRSVNPVCKVNPQNGTLSVKLQIPTTPGRGEFGPTLELAYVSNSGNGLFGIGWNLSLGSIVRKTSNRIPKYDETDIFVFSDAGDLVPLDSSEDKLAVEREWNGQPYTIQRYRARIQRKPTRIELWTCKDPNEDQHWRVISSDNVVSIYGMNDDSRIYYHDSTGRKCIFSWLISESYDGYGNGMSMSYKREDSQGINDLSVAGRSNETGRDNSLRQRNQYLKSIKYCNREPNRDLESWIWTMKPHNYMFEIVFDYGEHDASLPTTDTPNGWLLRQDAFSSYKSGFEIRTYRLCRRILMFHHMQKELKDKDFLVSSTRFEYDESPAGSLLKSVTAQGFEPSAGALHGRTMRAYPPVKLSYTQIAPVRNLALSTMDTEYGRVLASPETLHAEWIDLDSEGIPGLLVNSLDGTWTFRRNRNHTNLSKGQPSQAVEEPLKMPLLDQEYIFEDFNHDGLLSVVSLNASGGTGYYERLEDGWSGFKAFESSPKIDAKSGSVKRLDLTGDGLSDLIVQNEEGILWHQSLAKQGYSTGMPIDKSTGIPDIFTSGTKSDFYLLDMSGDGLKDIVRITRTRVSYWPNLGYGRFGPEITMNNCPDLDTVEQFSYKRIFLGDFNGSGTSDILYLRASGGATLYHNLSGNGWSEGDHIEAIPQLDLQSPIFMVDLLGTGIPCFCWSGPESRDGETGKLHYVDLSGGLKPYLLEFISNNQGKLIKIDYLPSTSYAENDKQHGHQWQTKLAFPFHCANRMQVFDLTTDLRSTTRYAYHEGFYDRADKEFSGFAMVEAWEERELSASYPPVCRPVAPTHTKTWYAVGGLLINRSTTHIYGSARLEASVIPHDSQPVAYECSKALKGYQIRQEIYGATTSTTKDIPYKVVEQNFEVRIIQAIDRTGLGVCRIIPREKLTTHYERNFQDPRIKHEIILEVDNFDKTTKSVLIAYGKKQANVKRKDNEASQDEIFRTQQESAIHYLQFDYTNPVNELDEFHSPVIAEKREYVVPNIDTTADKLIRFVDLQEDDCSWLRGLPEVMFEERDVPQGEHKILISASRHYYNSKDMMGRLAYGCIEAFSTLDRSYTLCLTPALLKKAYQSSTILHGLDVNKFISSIGYIELVSDKQWWKASERVEYGDGKDPQLAAARRSFFIPSIICDTMDYRTLIHMDDNHLLPQEIVDALGNITRFEYDYAFLQISRVTDCNSNHKVFSYDCHGNLAGAASIGKANGSASLDSLVGFKANPTDDQVAALLSANDIAIATQLLGTASRCTVLSFGNFTSSATSAALHPLARAEISRDRPGNEATIHIRITYLNGSGRTIQQVELVDSTSATNKWKIHRFKIQDSAGNVLRDFRASFTSSPVYVTPSDTIVPYTTYLYDPLSRLVGSIHPNQTYTKTIFNPWDEVRYNAGATIAMSYITDLNIASTFPKLGLVPNPNTWYDQHSKTMTNPLEVEAAEKSMIYKDSTIINRLDTCGRRVATKQVSKSVSLCEQYYYDPAGNKTSIRDGRNRLVEKLTYDLLGNVVAISSMDHGKHCRLLDAAGNNVLQWNSRGKTLRFTYDALGRECKTYLLDGQSDKGDVGILTTENIYGELATSPEQNNLRGEIWQVYDQSGVHQNQAYDLYGNCVKSSTIFASVYRELIDWSNRSIVLLEPVEHNFAATFDALGREIQTTNTDGSSTQRTFTLTGQIKTTSRQPAKDSILVPYIVNSTYNAENQPISIEYGNGTSTIFEYDQLTGNTVSRKTARKSNEGITMLEHQEITYDCLGRITHITDHAEQAKYFLNCRVSPGYDYTYNGLGHLILAKGREQLQDRAAASPQPTTRATQVGQFPQDRTQLFAYSETYNYDRTGNFTKIILDLAGATGWTMDYSFQEQSLLEGASESNRLSSISINYRSEDFAYDDDDGRTGCPTKMVGRSTLKWDFMDRLRSSSTQRERDGMPVTTWYVYDHSGRRVRKVTERISYEDGQPRRTKETLYLPDYEIYTVYEGDGTTVGNTIQTAEVRGSKIIALIENGLERYQTSTSLELDNTGAIISYEEYSPFGRTTVAAHRPDVDATSKYRYRSYERESETGLHYCHGRYYAPWLGRFISYDPRRLGEGTNLYPYASNDPVNMIYPHDTA